MTPLSIPCPAASNSCCAAVCCRAAATGTDAFQVDGGAIPPPSPTRVFLWPVTGVAASSWRAYHLPAQMWRLAPFGESGCASAGLPTGLNWPALDGDSSSLCDVSSGFDPATATNEIRNKADAKRTARTSFRGDMPPLRAAFRPSTRAGNTRPAPREAIPSFGVLQSRTVPRGSHGPAALFRAGRLRRRDLPGRGQRSGLARTQE
jgi:hypothetical protein